MPADIGPGSGCRRFGGIRDDLPLNRLAVLDDARLRRDTAALAEPPARYDTRSSPPLIAFACRPGPYTVILLASQQAIAVRKETVMPISKWCLVAASMLALTAAGCPASASSSSQPRGNEKEGKRYEAVQDTYEVIHLHGKMTHYKRLNNGDRATGVGSQVFITENLFRNGSKYGFSATSCTQVGGPLNPTAANPATQLCSGVFSHRNGQVTWQNTLPVSRQGTPPPWKTAITGGTGAYTHARGYILVNGTQRNYTVYLLRTSPAGS